MILFDIVTGVIVRNNKNQMKNTLMLTYAII